MDGEAGAVQTQLANAAASFDRRRSPRFDLNARLLVRPADQPSRLIHGRVFDLSRGGISALIAAELQVGDVLEAEFGLPYNSGVLRVEVVVRARRSYRYGLEFARMVPADRTKINQTCAVLEMFQ